MWKETEKGAPLYCTYKHKKNEKNVQRLICHYNQLSQYSV